MEVDNFDIQHNNSVFFFRINFSFLVSKRCEGREREKIFQRQLELIKYSVSSRISQVLVSEEINAQMLIKLSCLLASREKIGWF